MKDIATCETDCVTDRVTDRVTDQSNGSQQNSGKCTWIRVAEEIMEEDFMTSSGSSSQTISKECEIIDLCSHGSKEFKLAGDNIMAKSADAIIDIAEDIPEWAFWHSVLTALENCKDYPELEKLVNNLVKKGLPAIKPRVRTQFTPGVDITDTVAQKEIPADGPTKMKAIATMGDGNCLG